MGTNLAAEQVFKYRVLDNINALDPQIAEDVDTSHVNKQLFEGLYSSGARRGARSRRRRELHGE